MLPFPTRTLGSHPHAHSHTLSLSSHTVTGLHVPGDTLGPSRLSVSGAPPGLLLPSSRPVPRRTHQLVPAGDRLERLCNGTSSSPPPGLTDAAASNTPGGQRHQANVKTQQEPGGRHPDQKPMKAQPWAGPTPVRVRTREDSRQGGAWSQASQAQEQTCAHGQEQPQLSQGQAACLTARSRGTGGKAW